MATSFKNVADNAATTSATSFASTGVTSITVATGKGALFPVAPFYVTLWTGSDPGADANMEKVTCTAISGDVLTVSATTKTHAATVNVANLEVAAQFTDVQTAVNAIENAPYATTGSAQTISAKTMDNTNSFTIKDGNLQFQNSADTTKRALLDLSGLGTGITYTYKLPPDGSPTEIITGTAAQTLKSKTLAGVLKYNRTAVADTNYTVLSGDLLVALTSITASRTITLPTAVGSAGQTYYIKDETGALNSTITLTIATTSSQTVDGKTSIVLNRPYDTLQVESDGTNWKLLEIPQSLTGGSAVVDNEIPGGTPNGVLTTFTTAAQFATNSLNVYRNGIRLKGGGVDYTVNAGLNGFTMTTAPNTGDSLLVDYNVWSSAFTVGTNSSTTNEQPTGTVNGTTTVFTTLRPYIASSLQVYIDGIMQRRGTDYTETTPSTGSFTMAAAPLTGQSILVDYQFNLNPSSNADTVDGIHASSTATANQLFPLDGNAKFGTDIQYDASDRIADHVVSGGVVALSSGLIGTFSDIVYYIGGKRYTATGIANHTYTVSNDCYVDIDTTGTVTYTTGANNFASPTLAANSIRIAVVVTNGSTISYVHQGKIEFGVVSTGASAGKLAFSDGKGYPIYPTQAVQKIVAGLVRNSASTTGQPGATSAAYNGIANLPFQAKANTNYKLKFYEPVVSGMTANGVWVIEFYLSASTGAYTTRVDEFSALMLNTTAATGIYVEIPFNSGSYSGLTYLEFKLRTAGTTGTATMNGDTSTRMGRFYIETA